MELDYNIYGIDETSTAAGISSDALMPSSVDGGVIGSSRGSKGGGGDEVVATGDVSVSHKGCGSDSRAVTKGNHGKQG